VSHFVVASLSLTPLFARSLIPLTTDQYLTRAKKEQEESFDRQCSVVWCGVVWLVSFEWLDEDHHHHRENGDRFSIDVDDDQYR